MVLSGHYDLWLVGLSYLIAALASYVALRLSPHCAPDGRPGPAGVIPAAVTLGIGIWGMHFTGTAAYHLHGLVITYRWYLTVLSLVVAVGFTAIGFATLSLLPGDVEGPLVAGIPMAAGILSMHFLGMMAMRGEMDIRYEAGPVIAAGAIALFASTAALWLSTLRSGMRGQLLSAGVMGAAICGMHYTGMQAAVMLAG